VKLWILRGTVPTNPPTDVARGFVIRAATEEKARTHATRRCGDEGAEYWLSDKTSSCMELSVEGPAAILLRDFRDG
jgi:hypothetical protein